MRMWTIRLARLVVAAAIGLGTLTVVAPEAQAAVGAPPESGLLCVNMSPNACWAHQVVFRGDPMLEFATWTKAKWPNGFNHDNNGCSVEGVTQSIPAALADWVDEYAAFFRPACRIHDFGYRNFGSGTIGGFTQYAVKDNFLTENQKSWNETTGKLTIDHRFGDLMHGLCDDGGSPDPWGPNDTWCNRAADAFEFAVRNFGDID